MSLNNLADVLEGISADYSETYKIRRDNDWFILKIHEELGELTQAYLRISGRKNNKGMADYEIKENLEEEIADLICHALIFARHNEIDIDAAINRKWINR